MPTLITIMLVDDHPVVRQGLRSLLSDYSEFQIVAETDDGAKAILLAAVEKPDVILLDISMPKQSGLSVLPELQQKSPSSKILLLTSYDDDEYVMQALEKGAQGYILKNASDESLVQGIKDAYRGNRVLSPQITERVVQKIITPQPNPEVPQLKEDELQILRLLAAGASNAEVASQMFISNTTMKRKIRSILEKMAVQSRVQAVAEAVRQGMI